MNPFSIKIILALAIPSLLGSANVCRAQVQAPAQAQIPAQAEWPKSIITPSGAIINLYQPQVLSYSGELVKSRSVISVKDAGADDLVFGVAWTTATVTADSAGKQLAIRAVRVDQLRIPDDTNRADNAFIAVAMEEFLPQVLKSIPEQEVQQSLNLGKQEKELAADTGVAGVAGVAPVAPVKILFATKPTALVRTLRKIANDLKAASYENGAPIDDGDEPVRRILVRTEPTLLIQLDGKPKFKPIQGTSLSYIANDPENIYFDRSTQYYYVPIGESVVWSPVTSGIALAGRR